MRRLTGLRRANCCTHVTQKLFGAISTETETGPWKLEVANAAGDIVRAGPVHNGIGLE